VGDFAFVISAADVWQFISISVVRPLEIVDAIADAKECSQLICSALNVALSIRPVTGILATDRNQRIALSVSGPIVPSTGP